MKRVALYLRVSTCEQTTENQRRELDVVAAHSGWEIVQVYEDAGISGTKGRDKRPALNAMLKDATRRKFDLIAAWSVDRLGRSLQDLVGLLNEVNALGINVYLHQQALDTTTPAGRAFFQMSGVFAEFERAMIQERVKAGIARARSETLEQRTLKRKKAIGRPRLEEGKRLQIVTARSSGLSYRATAKVCSVAVSTVQEVMKSAA